MMTSQEKVFEINKAIFKLSYQKFYCQSFINIERLYSKFIHFQISIPKQYQMMMSSVASVKFIKTKFIFSYHTKVSLTKFHQNRITKSIVIHVQIPFPKWKKTKKWGNIF